MRLSRAAVLVPCCSAVGPYPEAVAPGQTVLVPTQLNTGVKTGLKRVEFVVRTDNPTAPAWSLALTADLVARQEVVPWAEASWSTPTAQAPGRWVWRAITRHLATGRPLLPVGATIADPLRANLLDAVRTGPAVGGVVEVEQEIEVTAPPTAGFGRHNALLSVRFDDGSTSTATVTWVTTDPIRVDPPGVVLNRSAGITARSFSLRSAGDPVGIAGIACDLLAEPFAPTGEAARLHRFDLKIDPTRGNAGATVPITLRLTGASPREVTISVLILDHPTGAAP